ncbi:glycosyltransferase family 4 protein [Prevotella sp. E2-28]|uniref:glycosyltransferase family 4 protein n=1 Tax=Prevotella sp. E2-28 TaxID=2913620 RepID=UPI001EDAAA04|nr:glycosyltransferase family 4 protein [Prevotella sp. E2-28]UKK54775.1 glycosyltransferase family 4 protein [Prevotella sp. E2-28]
MKDYLLENLSLRNNNLKNMDNKKVNKKIAIIGPESYPIPAVRGGAIESGVTRTLNINEEEKRLDLTVFTISDPLLEEAIKNYKNCRIIQIARGGLLGFLIKKVYRVLRKFSGYRLPFRSAYMIRINKYLEKENFDLIAFHTSHEEVSQLSSKVKAKVIYSVASDYLTPDIPGITQLIERVDCFSSNQYIIDRIHNLLGVGYEKLHAGKGGIDISLDSNEVRTGIRYGIRTKHNLTDKDVVVLYCGRLSPEKGALQLIQAVQKVPNCKLIVVGGANFSSNAQTEYVKSLKDAASKCNGRVIFTGYLDNHDDLKKYAYAADIAVVPSICNEAGSVALLEFRVVELPTIASDKGGMIHNAAGNVVFVRCDDNYVNNLAEAIGKLVRNPEERKKLSKLARIGIEDRSLEAKYDRLCDFYDSL